MSLRAWLSAIPPSMLASSAVASRAGSAPARTTNCTKPSSKWGRVTKGRLGKVPAPPCTPRRPSLLRARGASQRAACGGPTAGTGHRDKGGWGARDRPGTPASGRPRCRAGASGSRSLRGDPLAHLDEVAVGIAHVAAQLRAPVGRRRQELGAAASPFPVDGVDVGDPDIENHLATWFCVAVGAGGLAATLLTRFESDLASAMQPAAVHSAAM